MRNRDNVYAKVDEKNVMTLKVYANEANVLFYDAEHKKAVLTDIVEDLFLKGLTVVSGAKLLKAIAFVGGKVVCYDGEAKAEFTATAVEE